MYYPVISWLDFVDSVEQWQIIYKNLKTQNVDQTFIAVNFEDIDLDINDDKSVCRYEFLEIIARLAKIKY